MIALVMRLFRRGYPAANREDRCEKHKRQAKERDVWEEMRELELRGEVMTAITLQLGTKVSIDGEIYTVVSASEVLDGDMGCGPVTRKKILILRSVSSGVQQTIMTEVDE